MPVTTAALTETDVVTTVSASPQLLLASPGVTGRFWLEVVNPLPDKRLYVATSAAACTAAAKAADPYGVWDGPIGASSPLYYMWEAGTTGPVTVRVIQYA